MSYDDEMDEVREDLARLRSDAASLVEALIDTARGNAGTISRQLMSRAEDWIDDLRHGFSRVRRSTANRLSFEKESSMSTPLLGLVLGAGAVIALSALMSQRRRPRGE